MPKVHIDVMLKDEILDPQGQAVERQLPTLGFGGVREVRIGKHIVLDVDDASEAESRVEELCAKLLANPVIESWSWRVEQG